MKRFLMLFAPLALSAQAFAWPGGSRPSDQPKIPVDTGSSKKSDAGGGVAIVEGFFSNRSGSQELLCDIVAQITARRGSDETIVKAFVDRRVVKPYREFSDRFVFNVLSEAGPGYQLTKDGQRYEASCLQMDPGQGPGQGPSPHDSCDPEWTDCDWTCKSGKNDPDQCGNPNQDWPA